MQLSVTYKMFWFLLMEALHLCHAHFLERCLIKFGSNFTAYKLVPTLSDVGLLLVGRSWLPLSPLL
jgi:hypothetical protein